MGRKSSLQKEIEEAQANFEARKTRFIAKHPDISADSIRNVDDLLIAERDKREEERLLEVQRNAEISKKKKEACTDLMAVQWDAHALYMNYTSIPRIIALTGLDRAELHALIYGEAGWKRQRDALTKEIKEEVKHQLVNVLVDTVGAGVNLIRDGIMDFKQKCDEANRKPTLYECDTISKIFAKLHKAKIIEEEGEDPSKRKESYSPQQLLNALAHDHYLRAAIADARAVTEAEFEVINEEERNGSGNSDSLATFDR